MHTYIHVNRQTNKCNLKTKQNSSRGWRDSSAMRNYPVLPRGHSSVPSILILHQVAHNHLFNSSSRKSNALFKHALRSHAHICTHTHLIKKLKSGVVVHAFNPSNWEAEAGGFLSSRPAWSTEWVPGQPEQYRETLSQKTKRKKKKKGKKYSIWPYCVYRFSIMTQSLYLHDNLMYFEIIFILLKSFRDSNETQKIMRLVAIE